MKIYFGMFLALLACAYGTATTVPKQELQTETERAREVASLLAHARGTVPPVLFVVPDVRDVCFGTVRGKSERVSQISVNGNCSNIVSGDGNNINVSCTGK